jgi:hypothetical protein
MPKLRLITHNGKTQSVSAWGRELGIPHVRIFDRLKIGWTFERAISEPLQKKYAMLDTCITEGCDKKPVRSNMCASCYNRKWRASKGLSYNTWWRNLSPEEKMYYNIRNRANKTGIECTIAAEDIKIPEKCPVLGIPLFSIARKTSNYSPSIDRIDPNGGYTPENIRVISMKANQIKNNGNLEEILAVAAYVSSHAKLEKPPG